jgi:hypothetical protein
VESAIEENGHLLARHDVVGTEPSLAAGAGDVGLGDTVDGASIIVPSSPSK